MNKERLLDLADRLETVPPKHFDFSDWATEEFCTMVQEAIDPKNLNPRNLPVPHHPNCETTACAIGYLTIFHPECWYVDDAYHIRYRDLDTKEDMRVLQGTLRWFDIDRESADQLFVPRRYNRYGLDRDALPGQVANAIRKFVSDGGLLSD